MAQINVTIQEANTSIIPSAWTSAGIYVQGKSGLRVYTEPGHYGSASGFWNPWMQFSHCVTTIEGIKYTTTANQPQFNSAVLSGAGVISCAISAYNYSDGGLGRTIDITVQSYANPYVSTFTVARCNSAGTEVEDGTYVKIKLAAGVSSVGGRNTYQYRVYYKESNASGEFVNYFTVPTPLNTVINKTWVAGGSFSADKSYIFEARVIDVFTSSKKQANLPTSASIIDIRASGKGIAFGKAAEVDNLVDSYWPLKAPSIQVGSNADLIYEVGTWTPLLTAETSGVISSYHVQQGRYIKIGRLVVLTGSVYVNNKGNVSGTMFLGNFPFVSVGPSAGICGATDAWTGKENSGLRIGIDNNATKGFLPTNFNWLQGSQLQNGFAIWNFSIVYYA